MVVSALKIAHFFKCYDTTPPTDTGVLKLNIRITRILAYIGLCPRVVNPFALLKTIPAVLFFHIMEMGAIGHAVHYLSTNPFSFYALADDLAVVVTTTTVVSLLVYTAMISDKISRACEMLVDYNHLNIGGRPVGVEAIDKLFAKLANTYIVVFSTLGVLTWMYYLTSSCDPGEVSACGFIFEPYLFFVDLFRTPNRQVFLTLQCCCSYTMGAMAMCTLSQMFLVSELLIVNIDHLNGMIRKIPEMESRPKRRAQIGCIIRYHTFLISLNNIMNQLFSVIYALHLCVTPFGLGVIAYQLLGLGDMRLPSCVHAMCYIVLIILSCGCAERVLSHSETIREVAIESIPYDGDVATIRDMQMIILRAAYPMTLNAGKFAVAGNVLMGNIFRTVISVLTILQDTPSN